MKKFLSIILVLASLSAWADDSSTATNQTCRDAYKVATQDMLQLIRNYRDKKIDSKELAALSVSISAQTAGVRAACYFTESPQTTECSNKYKEIYQDVRAKVSTGALLTGNQTEVDANRFYLFSVEAHIKLIEVTCR